jgi:hypothetical protein
MFAPVKAFGPPALYGIHTLPFPALQSVFDGLYPPGHQWYWRADFVNALSDQAIALHHEHGAKMPTMQSSMHLYPIDGRVHDVGESDTAFATAAPTGPRSSWGSTRIRPTGRPSPIGP